MLLIYLEEKAWENLSEEQKSEIMADAQPKIAELKAVGKFLGGSPLQPVATATTVRLNSGKPLVTDGPFAEAREQLGGYCLIEAADLDEALASAKGLLGTKSIATIEIRPLATP